MGAETTAPLPFLPVVVIGAGRSGTNVLRDALVRLEGVGTWPCDEINPIWRHGNIDHPDDQLGPELARPPVRRFIRRAFERIWKEQNRPAIVVEKTCANSLRVPFVAAVLPEARFVYIVRDGVDILASAAKRWRGELEMPGLPYYLAKARYAPLTDLPRYGWRALRNRIAIRLGRQSHFDSWGPVFAGMKRYQEAPLTEIVARQWAACVTESDKSFAAMPAEQVFALRYEDFVADPALWLGRIMEWLGSPRDTAALAAATKAVRRSSVGKGRAEAAKLDPVIRNLLQGPQKAHGYLD